VKVQERARHWPRDARLDAFGYQRDLRFVGFVASLDQGHEAALPKQGMQAIPQQLANRLKSGVLRSGMSVQSIEGDGVTLENGERVTADVVVLATTNVEAGRLRAQPASGKNAAVTCLYYAADVSPVRGPWLVLNGEGTGPINNLCVPSELHANYAPAGKALVSVTVLGVRDDLEAAVRTQLVEWYGEAAQQWTHLRSYAIPEALLIQEPPLLEVVKKPVRVSERLFACGDYLAVTSIEGAISSGIRCADEMAGLLS